MLRRVLTLAALILGCGVSVYGQGYRIGDAQPVSSSLTSTSPITPLQATVAVCVNPANAVPCTNKASTFTSVTLATPCSASTQVVLAGTTTCVAQTDSRGNWGAWVAAGNYDVTFTLPTGQSFGPYTISVGIPAGTNISPGNLTVTGTGIFTGSHTYVPSGSSLATAISSATAGQSLDIACGTYSISSTLTLTQPINIRGQAPAANFTINSVQFGSYTPCVKIIWTGGTGSPMIDVTNLMGVIIDSIVLDGGGLASRGMHIKGTNKSNFTNLTFNNFVAGNATDAAMEWEGGDTNKTNVQWDTFYNIALNNVVKGWHVYSNNASTDSATNTIFGIYCTLVSGAGDYCLQIDSADNNDWYDFYAAFVSGSTGSCITLNDSSGTNKGAQAQYFFHLQCNSNMTVVSNVAPATGTNYVYGYDKSNGMPDVSGLHPGNLIEIGSSDSTQFFKLANQSRITWENGAENARVSVMRLDASNNVIAHQGTGGCWQNWNSAEGATVAQFCDTQIFFQQPTFMSAAFSPFTAGANDLGTAALPFGNLWLGTAATNNFKFQPAATAAARIVAIPDPGTNVNLAFTLIATSAAFATATTAGTCVQNTTAVAGAATTMTAAASPVSTPGVGAVWSAFVSSSGNVTINECAVATSAGGSIAFNIRVTP